MEIVATDITPFTLELAEKLGADRAINVASDAEALKGYAQGKGHFDVLMECSGVGSAVTAAIPALRPRGIIVQLGLGGDMTLPVQLITAKEIELRGSMRFHSEFFTAVEMLRQRRLDVSPLITQTFAVDDAVEAFEVASDRHQAIKAQIAFA